MYLGPELGLPETDVEAALEESGESKAADATSDKQDRGGAA
jgi:hypothetical protein